MHILLYYELLQFGETTVLDWTVGECVPGLKVVEYIPLLLLFTRE